MEMEIDMVSILVAIMLAWTLVKVLLLPFGRRGGNSSRGKLPPGPTPLPFIGSLHKLGDKPHKTLADLAKTHGPIMSLKLGQITSVIISSPIIAKQVLQKQDILFSNRYPPNALHAHQHFNHSVVFLPSSTLWRSLRKILNAHMFSNQNLDMGQDLRGQKVQDLISHVHASSLSGDAVDIGRAAFTTSLNLLSNTIFSVDLADPNSDSAQEFKDLVWNIMVEAGKPNLVDYFPVLQKLDPLGIRGRMETHFGKMFEVFRRMIDHRLELRRSSNYNESHDVLDALLKVIEEGNEEISRIDMEHLFLDLFAAGTDTTSSTLEWAMTEMLRNPEIQSKVKAELEQTLGRGCPLQESDIARLPYLQAFVKETFRLHPSVPFLIPRRVEKDVEVCGYTVPKGAQVLVNAWAIGRDASVWTNPEKFDPERFLGLEVDVRGQHFELIPFGAGRRICPGLPLGLRMVHLMLGSLVNSFDWKLEGGIGPEDLDMDDKFGITLQKAKSLRAIPISIHG